MATPSALRIFRSLVMGDPREYKSVPAYMYRPLVNHGSALKLLDWARVPAHSAGF